MEVSGEVADLLVREGLQVAEVAAKLAGKGIVSAAALIVALLKGNYKTVGKVGVNRLNKENITTFDSMELSLLGERKQAVFCIIPDSNDSSLNFLVGMLYTQAFQELYYQADKVHGGALPVPVRLMFRAFITTTVMLPTSART